MTIKERFLKYLPDFLKQQESVDSHIIASPEIPPVLPTTRRSSPDYGANTNYVKFIDNNLSWVTPDFDFETIPLIRKLIRTNPNFGQAIWNIVNLGNTGHRIVFDSSAKPEDVDKMRLYLAQQSGTWAEGCANADGVVNRMMMQIMVSGALSNEWIPSNDLKSMRKVAFIKPELIRFKYNPAKDLYEPYQLLSNASGSAISPGDSVKLNPYTYKYVGLQSDGEIPYGIPPYITALDSSVTQDLMVRSIRIVAQQLGLPGFLQVKIEKPRQTEGENDTSYKSRLESYLLDAKSRLAPGFNEGIVVGFTEDAEMEFQGIAKNSTGSDTLFNINEQQMITGLKSDGGLFGRDFGTSETQLTIVLTKLISELVNIQSVVKGNLEFGYAMALKLAGFKFKTLEVRFNRSTLLDELKLQQGVELKIKNLHRLYYDGIISLEQYADEMGYEKSDQKEPRYLWDVAAGEAGDSGDKEKDRSRKKSERTKSKPQEKKL